MATTGPVIVPHPNTIREPIEKSFNGLRDDIEKKYVDDRLALEEKFHADLKLNEAAKASALVSAGLNSDGSTPSDYPFSISPGQPPENTVAPTITGTPTVGEVLTLHEGTWSNEPTFTYQWVRADSDESNSADIVGEQDTTYTLVAGDEGKKIAVVVTGTNADGQDTAMSAYTAAIAAS